MADQTIRDDELAAAEDWARTALDRTVPTHLVTLLAEYDRRGAIEARTVKQVEHVLAYVPGPDPDDQGEDWHERVVAELERLRAEVAEIRAAKFVDAAATKWETRAGLTWDEIDDLITEHAFVGTDETGDPYSYVHSTDAADRIWERLAPAAPPAALTAPQADPQTEVSP